MKESIIKSLKQTIADRYLLALLSTLILLSLIFAITVGLSIHPSETKLVSHYSTFGITHFYRDQWFYLFTFVLFGISAAVLHSIISIKLLIIKGHSLAVMFAWSGISVVLLGWVTVSALLSLRAQL